MVLSTAPSCGCSNNNVFCNSFSMFVYVFINGQSTTCYVLSVRLPRHNGNHRYVSRLFWSLLRRLHLGRNSPMVAGVPGDFTYQHIWWSGLSQVRLVAAIRPDCWGGITTTETTKTSNNYRLCTPNCLLWISPPLGHTRSRGIRTTYLPYLLWLFTPSSVMYNNFLPME